MHGLTGVWGDRPEHSSSSRVRRPHRFALLAVLGLMVLALSPLMMTTADAAQSNWSPPRAVYIPETGHSIDGVFLDFWRANSGISLYGYPISPELKEEGRVVQYYQYARFEYWPEDPNGNVVRLGKIGEEFRPHLVYRSRGAFGGATEREAAAEAAAMARAWLPLTGKAAKQENSDSWRFVPETGHSVQFGFKAFWEATGEATYLGYPLTEEYTLDGVVYQVFERGQLAWKQGGDPFMVPLGEVLAKRAKIDTGAVAQGNIPIYDEALWIPPPPPMPNKWIEINLSSQYLIAWENGVAVMETYISSGKAGFETPPGSYYISTKLPSEHMEGVLGGEYYNVPSVPDVMYFTGVGHAIHGAYWHNNFGAPMSHGCINVPLGTSTWLYNWAPSGTPVEISY
ncbi:MAG: L,D-transpeptidase family protein [Thermomicrobiales bacterium]